jgi:DNA-binding transcriptional LysR family regulator
VRLEYQHPHRVYDAVEKDHADLGLVSYPRASRTIEALGWREEPMVLVCAPGHRLAEFKSIKFSDLNGQRMIGFDSDLTIRREIDRILQMHEVEVRVAMEFDNIETIKRAVEIDAGVALLPEPTVLREAAAGTLAVVPLESDELVRPLGIIHRRGKELGSTTRRFIELLQSVGQQLTPLECQECLAADPGQFDPAVEPSDAQNGHAAGTNGTAAPSDQEMTTSDNETPHDPNARPRRAARVKAK